MGVKVIDKAGQKEVEVSSGEAQQAILDGRAVLPSGKLKVRAAGNRTGTVDADKLGQALSEGWQIADDDEVAAATLRREESDVASSIGGGLEAALAGATLGASTWAEANLLGVDPERMRARREGLGTLGTGLEVAGALAPALLTGGTSAVGSGATGAARAGMAARVAGATPAGALTRGGAAIEQGLGVALREAPALIRTTVPVAGRGAVEGFVAGVGDEVDESVLGEREITAERLWSSGGMGALLGGTGGAVVPGVIAAGAGLGKVGVRSVKSILGAASGATDGVGSGLLSRVMSDDNIARWARLNDLDPESALRIGRMARDQPAKLQEYLNNAKGLDEQIASGVRAPIEDMRDALSVARREISGPQKLRALERKLPKSTDELLRAHESGLQQLDAFETRIKQALDDHANGFIEHQASDLRSILRMVQEAKTEIGAVAAKANGRTGARVVAANVHHSLDRLKQGADDVLRQNRRIAPTRASQNTVDLLAGRDGVVSGLRSHLEDSAIWGEAGTAQASINAAASNAIQQKGKLTGASKRLFSGDVVDNADLLSVTRGSGRFSGATKTELFEDALAGELAFFDEVAKHIDLPPSAKAAIDRARSAGKRVRDSFDGQREKVRTMDDLEHLRISEGNRSPSLGMMSTMGPTVLGALGLSVAGPIGAAAGAVAGMVTRPYTMVRKLAAIQARAQTSAARESKAVGKFLSQIEGKALGAGKDLAAAGGRVAPIVSGPPRHERLDAVRKKAAAISANPSLLDEGLRKAMIGIDDAAPQLTGVMHQKARVAAAFLASKIPAGYRAPYSTAEPLTDPVAEMKFENYVEAVDDPDAVVERLADGTFTLEHAEALRAVWPAKYRALQTQVMDSVARAGAEGRELPLSIATELELLFAVKLTPTLPLAAPPPDEMSQVAMSSAPAKVSADIEVDTDRVASPTSKVGRME